jgi:ketosteroid isomerase-like protein
MSAGDHRVVQSPVDLIAGLRHQFAAHGDEDRMLGDADVFADTIGPHATEDLTCVMDAGALKNRFVGLEGVRAGWRDFLSAFDEIEIVPGELHEGPDGESVIEFVHLIGTPAGVDGQIDHKGAAVWRVRDGRIYEVEFHLDRAAALRSGGLDPDDYSSQA